MIITSALDRISSCMLVVVNPATVVIADSYLYFMPQARNNDN